MNCGRKTWNFFAKMIKGLILRGKNMKDKRQEYIEYFTYMQEEDKKIPLGGMAWDDICWWIYDATEKDKLFTRNELADMFPDLLGHIRVD